MNDVFAKGDVDIVTVGREQPRGLTYSSIRRGELEDRETRDTASWLVSCLVVTVLSCLLCSALCLLVACGKPDSALPLPA